MPEAPLLDPADRSAGLPVLNQAGPFRGIRTAGCNCARPGDQLGRRSRPLFALHVTLCLRDRLRPLAHLLGVDGDTLQHFAVDGLIEQVGQILFASVDARLHDDYIAQEPLHVGRQLGRCGVL